MKTGRFAKLLWWWATVFAKTILSLIFGAIFYTGWLAVAIPVLKGSAPVAVKAICWLSAPVVTALGFALGVTCFELLPGTRKTKFLSTLKWTLTTCCAAAAAVAIFGPMLIVFAMLTATPIAIAIRELLIAKRPTNANKKQ